MSKSKDGAQCWCCNCTTLHNATGSPDSTTWTEPLWINWRRKKSGPCLDSNPDRPAHTKLKQKNRITWQLLLMTTGNDYDCSLQRKSTRVFVHVAYAHCCLVDNNMQCGRWVPTFRSKILFPSTGLKLETLRCHQCWSTQTRVHGGSRQNKVTQSECFLRSICRRTWTQDNVHKTQSEVKTTGQCTYDVTMRLVRLTIVAVEKQYYILCVCSLSYPAC